MRLLSPLFSLRAPTRALRRISSHSRRSFFASHSGVHGWWYHSPPLPYFLRRAGGNSTHSAVSSRPQWAQIWSSSLSTSAGLTLFPEEPLVAFPAPGSRLSIRSTPHPPSAFPDLQRPAPYGPALLDEPELAVLLEALDVLDGLDAPLDPPLQDAPYVSDAPRVALAGDPERLPDRVRREPVPPAVPVEELQDVRGRQRPPKPAGPSAPRVARAGDPERLPDRVRREPVPPAVPVEELQDVRRRQRPHKPEVVVGRDPLGLGPDHLHVAYRCRDLLAGRLRRALLPAGLRTGSPGGGARGSLEPAPPPRDESRPHRGASGREAPEGGCSATSSQPSRSVTNPASTRASKAASTPSGVERSSSASSLTSPPSLPTPGRQARSPHG